MAASLLIRFGKDMEAAMPFPASVALAPATGWRAGAPCAQSASGSAQNQPGQGFGGLVQELLVRTAGELPAVGRPLQLASPADVPSGAGIEPSPKKNAAAEARNPSTVNPSLACLAAFFASSVVTPPLPLAAGPGDASAGKAAGVEVTPADGSLAAPAKSATADAATADAARNCGNGVQTGDASTGANAPAIFFPAASPPAGGSGPAPAERFAPPSVVDTTPDMPSRAPLRTSAIPQAHDTTKASGVPLTKLLSQLATISEAGTEAQTISVLAAPREPVKVLNANQNFATPTDRSGAPVPNQGAARANPPLAKTAEPHLASADWSGSSQATEPGATGTSAEARDTSSRQDDASRSSSADSDSRLRSESKPAEDVVEAMMEGSAAHSNASNPADTPGAPVQPIATPHQAAAENHTVPATADTSSSFGAPQPPQWQTAQVAQDAAATRSVSDAQLTQSGTHSEMRISMQSEKFGPIELHARVTGDEVGAAITVEKRDAHAALAAELPALHQALGEKQLRVEQVTLEQSSTHFLGGDCGAGSPSHQQQARSTPQRGNAGSGPLRAIIPASFGVSRDAEEGVNAQGRLSIHA
jgi:hypothetical protein